MSIVSIFLIVSIVIFFVSQTILMSPVYFLSSLFSLPRASLYSLVYADKTSDEISLLRLENTKLKEKLQELNTLKKDNEALRSQFEDATVVTNALVPAKVVGLKGSVQSPTNFILDQGTTSGIKKGMPVVVGQQLVGKIIKVSSYFSEVMLVVNKDFSTIAQSGENSSPGIIQGYDEFILFDHVVITDTISKKETVVTKGELDSNGVGIPPGFIVGEIIKVNKSDTKPLQSATVKSLLKFSSLPVVFVLKQ